MTTSINNELSKALKIQYLESLSYGDLAYWLIHSFSPERYKDLDIQFACKQLYEYHPEITVEFMYKLWAMFGREPEDKFWLNNVVKLNAKSRHQGQDT
jgi:hypothetical protein